MRRAVEILAQDGAARIRGVLKAEGGRRRGVQFKSSRPTWTYGSNSRVRETVGSEHNLGLH